NNVIGTHDYTARASSISGSTFNPLTVGGGLGSPVDAFRTTYGGARLFTGAIGTAFQIPSGTMVTSGQVSGNSVVKTDYENNSNEIKLTFNIGLNNANAGTNKSVYLITNIGCYQIEYDPVLPKDDTQTLFIPFILSWDRYVE
ncbi:MAG: hypothetical protein VXW65_03630, partial [Pseudomonadota bacterium]|nr:hypothetical protein [Pseudomonadota bacterium]